MASKTKLKIGDTVSVIAGKFKGQKGEIFSLTKSRDRLFIKGINLQTIHQKPKSNNEKGKRIKKEGPIHISNAMYFDPSQGNATKIRISYDENGKRTRISKKSKLLLN